MPKSGRQTRFERRSPFTQYTRRVQGEGPIPARLMLIGERPGQEEARTGRPFVGPAGQLLDTLLTAANLDRKDIYITNLVKDFKDYDKPTADEIEQALPELLSEIEQVNPEIIGLLGTFAVEAVLHRERAEMERTHGCPERNGDNRIYVPIFHPAAGLYNADTMANVLDDFLRLGQLCDGEISVRVDDYLGQEKYEEWQGAFYVQTDCAVDTEGTRRHPWCLTWSQKPGTAYLVKRVPPNSGFGGHVYLHNSLHDLGVLREMGIELGERQFTDTMVLAYHLCIEPQGLKALAYRHCGAHQDEYQDIIGNVGADKALEYLLSVSAQEWPAPEPYVVLDKGVPKMKKPQGINRLVDRAIMDVAEDKRDKDGNPVDLRERWNSKTWRLPRQCVIDAMGDMPVATLDDVDPIVAQNYACRDADITLRIAPILKQRIHDMGLDSAVQVDHDIIPMVDRMQQVGIQLAPPEFWQGIIDQCDSQMGRAKYEVYKLTGAEINPDSGDQVAELLYGQLGLKPVKMTDSGSRGAVDGFALESLLGDAPVVQPIMDYKEASKVKSTYAYPMMRLCQEGDGRAHSTQRLTRTTTGRLSMADPPLHQIPIMTEIGKQIRAGFVAPEGRILGDWDLDQIEMRMMAHESQDPELCRLFIAGEDIHSQTAAKIFSVPLSDIAGKKDPRRTVAKHAGFGIINGITEHGFYNYLILNRCKRPDGECWTLDDCAMLIDGWFDVYPGVKKFQQAMMDEAMETGLARESISGKIIYLPAVWHPTNKVMRESSARMSYVMPTQGGAAALIKKCMKVIWDTVCKRKDLETDPLLWVHDELLFECPDDYRIQEIDELVNHALANTVKLRVPVRASGGFAYNWLEAH